MRILANPASAQIITIVCQNGKIFLDAIPVNDMNNAIINKRNFCFAFIRNGIIQIMGHMRINAIIANNVFIESPFPTRFLGINPYDYFYFLVFIV
jgi:hypothetical protein